ncbi:MAG: hypothetical protein H3C31_04460 [Brumimicrobium sp.]|nr:hypothetical protein [Brumimicrobium sp.]
MAIPKIKTNLFSFKTFRSPDKIDINEINEFFIQHPDITRSQFNQCPIRNEDGSNEKEYNEFLGRFKPASSYKEIRNLNPEFYDFSSLLMQQKRNDSSKKPLDVEPPRPLTSEIHLKIWEELFVQTATQKSKTARQACLQMLIAQFYVENIKRIELKNIGKLVIVIPQVVTNCFRPWQYANCGGKLFGVHNLGIQEYRRVEQTLCCYVPGEVSHIENVMAREFKEKSTRNLLRTEQTTELTTETTIENINDTTTTERNELSSEIAKLLQKDKSFDISGSVTVSKDSKVFGSISANVSTGYNSSSSSSLSNTEAKNFAKEKTEQALERIEQKTTERRTYKIIKEFEENNKHGFDNRKGTKHVTGVYRWVDKIYDNELVNYGKRLVLEVEVPTPALLYKKAMEWKSKKKEEQQATLTPPKTLSDFGIENANDINSNNASQAASAYGTSIQNYESETQYLTVDIPVKGVENKSFSQSQTLSSIIIPTGFVAERIDGVGSFNYKTPTGSAYIEFDFSGYKKYVGDFKDKGTRNFDYHFVLTPNLSGSISFVVRYRRTDSYSASLKVKCVSDPILFKEWQENTLIALQEAYQKKLDEYNEALQLQQEALAAQADQEGSENFSNAAFNRLIEERELKRACIEMLSKPYCYEMGKRFYNCKPYKCTSCEDEEEEIEAIIPETIQNQQLEKYAEFIKFFETAFQWEIFSYIFYPYYYNEKCTWYELLQTKNPDPIFEAFLQSGMAKVLVPVRPQFEKAIMWYLDTGEIYTEGDLIPETADDRYESLLKDLYGQDEVRVEGTWQTRVPSMLTIIQAKSTYLEDEQGLPCCEEEDETFGSDDRLLEGLDNIDDPIIEE